jgi:hypothetical protein
MLSAGGYLRAFREGLDARGHLDPRVEVGLLFEADTYTCAHCGRVVALAPRQMPHGTCKSCMGFICEGCYHDLTAGTGVCVPMEKRLLMLEGQISGAILKESRLREYERHSARLARTVT